jgi:hypothetical protein
VSNKPWFDKQCSKLFDTRKQAKLQWLHIPGHMNRDKMNNARCAASRTLRIEKECIR